jgi:F-type H+-transporting ATPase subunit a
LDDFILFYGMPYYWKIKDRIQKHGLKNFALFMISDCTLALLPFLGLIEFISYLARNIYLGVRLTTNILSKHILLNTLNGFTYILRLLVYFFLFRLISLFK